MKFHLLAGASLASLAAVTAALPAHAYEASALAASVAVAGEVVHGRVTNAAGDALPGAEVIVRATGQRAVTNTLGQFDLSDNPMVLDFLGLTPGFFPQTPPYPEWEEGD